MDRMLVVVFNDENKAYEGKKALQDLDREGSINVYAFAVVARNANGGTTVKESDDVGAIGSLIGTSLGALIGALAGPAGMIVGTTAGLSYGSMFDLHNARIASDYLDDVARTLSPGKVAVAAQVEEEWTTPVDTRMEALGGTVLRRALSDVTDTVNQEDLDAMNADLAQFKAELAKERADRQAKIKEKISQLESKIQGHLQKREDRRRAAERLAEAKAQRLRNKADAIPKI